METADNVCVQSTLYVEFAAQTCLDTNVASRSTNVTFHNETLYASATAPTQWVRISTIRRTFGCLSENFFSFIYYVSLGHPDAANSGERLDDPDYFSTTQLLGRRCLLKVLERCACIVRISLYLVTWQYRGMT